MSGWELRGMIHNTTGKLCRGTSPPRQHDQTLELLLKKERMLTLERGMEGGLIISVSLLNRKQQNQLQ